jgi:putative tricarboxylic transport membrane protein
VLGDNAENAFRQSMLISQGTLSIFFSKGLVGVITSLALLMLFWPMISRGIGIIRGKNGRQPTGKE